MEKLDKKTFKNITNRMLENPTNYLVGKFIVSKYDVERMKENGCFTNSPYIGLISKMENYGEKPYYESPHYQIYIRRLVKHLGLSYISNKNDIEIMNDAYIKNNFLICSTGEIIKALNKSNFRAKQNFTKEYVRIMNQLNSNFALPVKNNNKKVAIVEKDG